MGLHGRPLRGYGLAKGSIARRGPGGGGGAEPFTPADLFSGYSGDWWTGSDLGTLFQDSAGTTPVTAASDPVGRWVGKVNATAATQGTGASRPTYRAGGYVETDGTDDWLEAALSITTYPLTIAVVIDGTATVTPSSVAGLVSMAGGVTDYRAICLSPTSEIGIDRAASNFQTTPARPKPDSNAKRSAWTIWDGTNCTFFWNEGTSGTIAANQTHAAAVTYIGRLRSSGTYSGAKLREVLVINRALSLAQRTQLRTYWGAV